MSQDRAQSHGDGQNNQDINRSQQDRLSGPLPEPLSEPLPEPIKELQWLANYFRTHGRDDISQEISEQLDRFQKPEQQTPMHGGGNDPE